ncbi:galactosyl transferase [Rhizobium sp. Leaf68]|nr:galactosyl transferase [Rhizobium sp. Leaf202]KQN81708.1 galactosyl transferase [Rhizobium sp. Leaf68]
MTLLTFIIPVRHQNNARDWSHLKANLTLTIASIANQTHSNWRGIIVANEGADLPPLPENFSVTWVTFPPNDIHDRGNATEADFLDAFRFDKGRRVLSGMLSALDSRFFMIVDDDDFVSARIVEFVSEHPNENGWVVQQGFVWNDGGKLLLCHNDFNSACGTSLIVRSSVYGLPSTVGEADVEWMKDILGSHRRVPPMLSAKGYSLQKLPFRGAVYRVANKGSHSGARGIVRAYLLNTSTLRRPWKVLRHLANLRLLSAEHRKEFFGSKG